jgi:hypothetical protein
MAQDSVGRVLHSRRALLSDPTAFRRGTQQLLPAQTPASASSFLSGVSGSYWERILTISGTIATTATGGIRQLLFQLFNGDGVPFVSTPILAGVGASKTLSFYGNQNYQSPNSFPLSQDNYGTQTSPTTGTTIVSATASGFGSYTIDWTVELQGTTTAGTDNDNFGLYANGSLVAQSVNGFELGTYPQEPTDEILPSAGIFAIKAINTATTGAVYSASLVITSVESQNAVFTIPDLMLESGWSYGITGINLLAGDQLSNIQVLLERYASDYANGGWVLEQEALLREIVRSELADQRSW